MWTGAYWIGINDLVIGNVWTYANGAPATYSNWVVGNPLTFDPYNCGMISSSGEWISARCDMTSDFFCMIKRK